MTVAQVLETFGIGESTGTAAGLGITLVTGVVASGVCPCTLPVGLGVGGVVASAEGGSRRSGLWIAVAFFVGIVVNLTLLGAAAGRLGAVLTESFGRSWALAMAVGSVVAAGVAFWGPRLRVRRLAELRRPGALGAFGYGFVFSLGTSAAPLLVLLTVSAAQGKAAYGALLAFVFGVGRGLPFLAVGLFAGSVVRLTQWGRWRWMLQALAACALFGVGLYYFETYLALR